jgi:quinolinate synthase
LEKEKMESEIRRLKKEHNAVILAHYYERDEIQAAADYIGDSLALAQIAANTDADTIVFCGVKFMAETAKILSPEKKVLLPVSDAGCPMADMATKEAVLEKKRQLDNPVVVSYVNTNADVKSVSDICCTSANAVNVVSSLEEDRVLFVPDKNLGEYVKENVKNKEIYLWDGYCPTHEMFSIEDLNKLKNQHPDAKVAVHPESPKAVRDAADFVGSTSGIISYVQKSEDSEFIIGTEEGVLFEIKRTTKGKSFYVIGKHSICTNMKKTHIEDLYNALKYSQFEINLEDDILHKAYEPIKRMISIKRG